jgi:hypothetical protein
MIVFTYSFCDEYLIEFELSTAINKLGLTTSTNCLLNEGFIISKRIKKMERNLKNESQ